MIVVSSVYMELESCYADKNEIGKGYGRMIWSHMEKLVEQKGVKRIVLSCSDVVRGLGFP